MNTPLPQRENPLPDDDILVDVRNLKMHFPVTQGILARKRGDIKAVDDVSFVIHSGETLGLVGESGSGKTTVGQCLLRLEDATSGEIFFAGENISRIKGRQLHDLRRRMQVIFQDPYASLNPRMSVGGIIGEALSIHRLTRSGRERQDRISELLQLVGLAPEMANRFPHEFSGGQRQRIGIARALAVQPEFIVADEPVSALDVSIQAQVLNLMMKIQQQFQLTYLFIAHDLAVVRHIADRVLVMYLGKVMEIADRDQIYQDARHPYTIALLAAAPIPDPVVEAQREPFVIEGDIPSPQNPPSGCVFHTRCPMAVEECKREVPSLREMGTGHWVACIRA